MFALFWAYLWGIETPFKHSFSDNLSVSFWAYLWGIETNIPWNLFNFTSKCFWAYLWGIETCFFFFHVSFPLCFEPTYEELKLCSVLIISPSYQVLSLPMRNWNSAIFCISSQVIICFEPTYEELKRVTNLCHFVNKYVFWAYLWGIETFKREDKVADSETFWAYLWGIETHPVHSWF